MAGRFDSEVSLLQLHHRDESLLKHNITAEHILGTRLDSCTLMFKAFWGMPMQERQPCLRCYADQLLPSIPCMDQT